MADDATREELYEQAQDLEIEGRSSMSKEELAAAVAKAGTATHGRKAKVTTPRSKQSGPHDRVVTGVSEIAPFNEET